MTDGPNQFQDLNNQIDTAQTAIDKVDSTEDSADKRVNDSDKYTRIFLAEVDTVQSYLQDNDIPGEEEYLKGILALLKSSTEPQTLTDLSSILHEQLNLVLTKIEQPAESESPTIPGKPTLPNGVDEITLKPTDTLTGIVKQYLGVDWSTDPNKAFILVKEIYDLMGDNANVDTPNNEKVSLKTIVDKWNKINWNQDALTWYKEKSQASKKDTWVKKLEEKSEEIGERRDSGTQDAETTDKIGGTPIHGTHTKQKAIDLGLIKIKDAQLDNSTQDNFDILNTDYAWNNTEDTADLTIVRVRITRSPGAIVSVEDAKNEGLIQLETGANDNSTDRNDYWIDPAYEWDQELTIKVKDSSTPSADTDTETQTPPPTPGAILTTNDPQYNTYVNENKLINTTNWEWVDPTNPDDKSIRRKSPPEAGNAYITTPATIQNSSQDTIPAADAYKQGLITLKDPVTLSQNRNDYKLKEGYIWANDTGLRIKKLPQTEFKINGKKVTLDYSQLSEGAKTALANNPKLTNTINQIINTFRPRALNESGEYGAEWRAKYSPFRTDEDGNLVFADSGLDDEIHPPSGMTGAQYAEILNTAMYQSVKTQENVGDLKPDEILKFKIAGTEVALTKTDLPGTNFSGPQKLKLETFLKTILERFQNESIDEAYTYQGPFQIDHDLTSEDAIEIKEGLLEYNDDIITKSELTEMNLGLSLLQMQAILNIMWEKTH